MGSDMQIDDVTTPEFRLKHAIGHSDLFRGRDFSLGNPFPAIAMPMHLALDAVSQAVSGGSESVFVKTYRSGALDPYDFAGAKEASERAGQAGVGPRLLEACGGNAVLFFEAMGPDWRMAMARDAQKRDVKTAIVDAKRTWHRTQVLSRTMSPFDVVRDYCTRLEPHFASGADRPLVFKGLIPFASMKQWMFRIEESLGAAGTDVAPVHGENTVSNILIGPAGRILLVDFDRAVNADPLFDLGGLSLDLCRSEDERMEVVEIYAGRADGAILARLKLYALVDDFLWGCWALLAEVNPGTTGPELYKYASNRFVRLSHHLQQFDVPHLLAKI